MKRTAPQSAIVETLCREGLSADVIAEFFAYHKANPRVWFYFQRISYQLLRTGRKYGAKAIMEKIRWEIDDDNFKNGRTEKFKVNNNFTAIYARIFLFHCPRFSKAFRVRKLGSIRRSTKPTLPQGELKFKRYA